MLPADHGDCLWLEYGDKERPRRVLIDGGTAHSYPALRRRIEMLPRAQRRFELFIITHIDADHIAGSLELLRDMDELGVRFNDVWFNGWRQISPSALGVRDGERVSSRLRRGVRERTLRWNAAFGGEAAVIPDPGEGKLPVVGLRGGLQLTLLSPTRAQLEKLRAEWLKVLADVKLAPGEIEDEGRRTARRDILGRRRKIDVVALADSKFKSDNKAANGSSIAVLAEYGGRSCLLTGDAYATTLANSLGRLIVERGLRGGRLPVGVVKLPHHGSRNNLSNELLNKIRSRRYLFSTNGNIFKHPNMESVARIIRHGGDSPQLFFNYRSAFNGMWDDRQLIEEYDYRVKYCGEKQPGFLRVNI